MVSNNTIQTVIDQEQRAVESYYDGEDGVMNYLVGKVLSEANGKPNPSEIQEKLEQKLDG